MLLEEAEKDAQGKLGVAVVTSDKAFMTTRDIYLKNGFTPVEESGKDQLLVKQLKDGPLPKIIN